jgi:hypothetical protein
MLKEVFKSCFSKASEESCPLLLLTFQRSDCGGALRAVSSLMGGRRELHRPPGLFNAIY